MCFRDTVTILGKHKQQVHHQRMMREVLEIMITMVSGLAVGLAVMSCFTKTSDGQHHMNFKKKSSKAVESVMDAAENICEKTQSVKEDIKSGFEDFKNSTNEVTDEISNLYDETSE